MEKLKENGWAHKICIEAQKSGVLVVALLWQLDVTRFADSPSASQSTEFGMEKFENGIGNPRPRQLFTCQR